MFSYHVDRHDILVSWTRSSPGPATWHQCQKLGSLSSAAALNKCFGLAQHEPWRAERFRRRFEEISPRSPRSLRDLHLASFWWLCAFVLVCVCDWRPCVSRSVGMSYMSWFVHVWNVCPCACASIYLHVYIMFLYTSTWVWKPQRLKTHLRPFTLCLLDGTGKPGESDAGALVVLANLQTDGGQQMTTAAGWSRIRKDPSTVQAPTVLPSSSPIWCLTPHDACNQELASAIFGHLFTKQYTNLNMKPSHNTGTARLSVPRKITLWPAFLCC